MARPVGLLDQGPLVTPPIVDPKTLDRTRTNTVKSGPTERVGTEARKALDTKPAQPAIALKTEAAKPKQEETHWFSFTAPEPKNDIPVYSFSVPELPQKPETAPKLPNALPELAKTEKKEEPKTWFSNPLFTPKVQEKNEPVKPAPAPASVLAKKPEVKAEVKPEVKVETPKSPEIKTFTPQRTVEAPRTTYAYSSYAPASTRYSLGSNYSSISNTRYSWESPGTTSRTRYVSHLNSSSRLSAGIRALMALSAIIAALAATVLVALATTPAFFLLMI